jgi:RNA polymerase sigma-70 factor (ECF subfamily)
VLILRDVLAMRAVEAAEILDTTTVAVNSALRRARSQLGPAGAARDELTEPAGAELQEILERYVDAFQRADVASLIRLLRADVELEMPPIPTWFTGRDAIAGFFATRVLHGPGQWHLIPTRANNQAAAVAYGPEVDGRRQAHGVQVLTLVGPHISRITAFNNGDLVPLFGYAPVAADRGGDRPSRHPTTPSQALPSGGN